MVTSPVFCWNWVRASRLSDGSFRLEVAGDEFFIDLLVHHTRSKCYVVVELKATAFKPEHAGLLNFYFAAVDAVDLLLTQTHPTYLPLLQRYAQALRARNALLKPRAVDEAALESFSLELVALGNELTRLRRELVPKLSPLARLAYRRISHDAEELRIEYLPGVKQDFAVELAQSRARERTYRATLVGPHRDDLQLLLHGQSAAKFGSEGAGPPARPTVPDASSTKPPSAWPS